METKFNIGEEVYLKCKVLGIDIDTRDCATYTVDLPQGNWYDVATCSCLEENLEKVPEVPKTKDYNITLTVPNITYKDMLSIYDKLESVMTDIVGSDEWDMIGAVIGEEKDNGTDN